ncbi:metal-dependent hydrolase [Salinimicrobium sediminilitoris]|uniref:metal-dependent hydrolase n=1 Tax=Salinimicrobium sediminilitoris TaxID=2876715 RepID=UPI001E2A7189|nr:metal-dependent hydrolase [Salinimicrobium sediminilitoris]MCC8361083.1 metal-dependent hydrolase [Salinimicrobium sediminilitoris]
MDSLTQIVLGAAVGEAVLGRKVGNKAMLYGAIAGTIPDLDALAGNFTDTITAIEVHRGFSHSIVFAVLAAPVFGYLISRIERKSGLGWKDWSWLMFWGLFTHPILDSFTTWGTQLFWPLDIRLAFKSIFVIDPLYTLPFLTFLILAMRRKKEDPKRAKFNRFGLIVSTGYLMLTLVLKFTAHQQFKESLEQQGMFYSRLDTRPTPLNTILWAANAEAENDFLIGYYSFFDEEMIRFEAVPKNWHYLGSLKKDKNVQRLIEISKGWYTISEKDGFLYFNDLRFGKLNPSDEDSNFAFSYKLIPEGGTIRAEEEPKSPGDGKQILLDLWERIKGN